MLNRILYMFIALFGHLTLHELGHVLFGTVTGYSLVSSQVLVFKIEKFEKHFQFRLAPMVLGGITYMIPKQEQQQAYVAYSLGGVIMNAFFAAMAAALSFLSYNHLTRFAFIFSVTGAIFAVCNTIPFWIDNWNNDGNDVYLLSRNHSARDAYFSTLQIERQLYLGKDLFSIDRQLFCAGICDNIYAWNLTQMGAFILLLEGRFRQQMESLSELTTREYVFLRERQSVLQAMILENLIVSGATQETIRVEAQHLSITDLLKKDVLTANRVLYALADQGILTGLSVPDEYLKEYQKQVDSLGSKANSILAVRLIEAMKKAVSLTNSENT